MDNYGDATKRMLHNDARLNAVEAPPNRLDPPRPTVSRLLEVLSEALVDLNGCRWELRGLLTPVLAPTQPETAAGAMKDPHQDPRSMVDQLHILIGFVRSQQEDTRDTINRLLLGFALLVGLLLVPSVAHAQVVAQPASHLGWTDVGQSAAAANGDNYLAYLDGATTGIALTGVTCVANGANADCTSNLPALTPGAHSLTMTETNAGAESPKSVALAFSFVVVVTPTGLKIVDVQPLPLTNAG